MIDFISLYRLYILFNVFTSILVISVLYDPVYNYITNTYYILLLINLVKIFNQGLIVKYLTFNVILKKLMVLEGLCDSLKVGVLSFIIINYKNIPTNIFTLFVFWILFGNFILIFAHCIIYRSDNYIRSIQDTENLEINQNYLYDGNRENYVEFGAENIPNPNSNYNTNAFRENYNVVTVKNIICSICLEEQKINENWTKIHCGHDFHKKCLYRWIEINNVCPTCRYLIIDV